MTKGRRVPFSLTSSLKLTNNIIINTIRKCTGNKYYLSAFLLFFAMLKYLNFVIGAEAAFRKGACPKLTGKEMVMQDLDYGKLTGTWYIQVMDKDGYHGYFPECHQE